MARALASLVASRWRLVLAPSVAIGVGAVFFAVLVGVALAANLQIGVALLLGACYGIVILYAPVWALVLFVPLIFLEAVPALNLSGKAAGLLIAVAWIGAVWSGRVNLGATTARHRRLFEALAGLLIWFCLTAVWATEPGLVLADLWRWVSVALLFTIVATWIPNEKLLLWFCGAFVLGAVLAVFSGLASGMVDTTGSAAPRLEGGAGDPNFLAAGLVAAIVLAAGLLVAVRHPIARIGCVVAILICTFGIAASQSRGGFLALIAVLIASLLIFRRRRIYVVLLCLGVVVVGAAYFSVTPAAWERISGIEHDGGSGRTGLWIVAWRSVEDHPIGGVGLKNYELIAKEYTREPGVLKNVRKIAEDPHLVHNTYLEALTETGVIGLLFLLAVGSAACYSAWLAGKRYEELGDEGMEAMARAVVVAIIGMLTSVFFVSAGVDKRLWILFALGPATLALAERRRREEGYRIS